MAVFVHVAMSDDCMIFLNVNLLAGSAMDIRVLRHDHMEHAPLHVREPKA